MDSWRSLCLQVIGFCGRSLVWVDRGRFAEQFAAQRVDRFLYLVLDCNPILDGDRCSSLVSEFLARLVCEASGNRTIAALRTP